MELFTGTVAASADTRKFRDGATRPMTAKDAYDLVNAEYLRSVPAPTRLPRHRRRPSALANPRLRHPAVSAIYVEAP
jgi:hypothetical protein